MHNIIIHTTDNALELHPALQNTSFHLAAAKSSPGYNTLRKAIHTIYFAQVFSSVGNIKYMFNTEYLN